MPRMLWKPTSYEKNVWENERQLVWKSKTIIFYRFWYVASKICMSHMQHIPEGFLINKVPYS